jgi:hypothetical protein
MDVAPRAEPTEPYECDKSRPVTASVGGQAPPPSTPPTADGAFSAVVSGVPAPPSDGSTTSQDACTDGSVAQGVERADDGAAADADDEPLPEGELPVIAGYVLERRAERSPAGTAYLAREESTRKPVVVRVLQGDEDPRRRRKLDSMIHVRHPNLFNAIATGVCAEGSFLVTERASGETAQAWLDRGGALPEHSAIAVVLQAARGLRQAAFHSVFHSDLSPSCLRIDASGRVRVEGTGLAALDPSSTNAPP